MHEYRVWCENGDLILVTDDEDQAEEELQFQREHCFCEGDDCGVIHLHGFFIQTVIDD